MKIIQLSDIHYCDKYLEEVQRCMESALSNIVDEKPDIIVLSGDLFEERLQQNSPAYLKAIEMVYSLATEAPVLILQGTFSHDAPRSLDVFKYMGSETAYDICVVTRICQVVYNDTTKRFLKSPSWLFNGDEISGEGLALFSCLPAINKGMVAAAVGAENAAAAVGEEVSNLLKGWSESHDLARTQNIPSIVISHGTVSECVTEHNVPMAGLDHEFTTGSLYASKADAVMLGHIHKFQYWTNDLGQYIAYPGSIGRLHFGEVDPKGFLVWNFGEGYSEPFRFIETPAKRLIDIEFTGLPDMQELVTKSKDCENAHVRIRFSVDEEHRSSIDPVGIKELFKDAAETKLECSINPIQRQRAKGIGQIESEADKLNQWCEITETKDIEALTTRLGLLKTKSSSSIVESI